MECKLCKKITETRLGYCFTCATCETIIEEGTNMYDIPIEKKEGESFSMAKLRAILLQFKIIQ